MSVAPRIATTDSKQPPGRFCHANDDDVIPVEHGRALFEADANAKKEMDFVRGGHHGRRALRLIQKWRIVAMEMLAIDSGAFMAVRYEGELHNHHLRCAEELIAFMETNRQDVVMDSQGSQRASNNDAECEREQAVPD
jgi:hypothetical protein